MTSRRDGRARPGPLAATLGASAAAAVGAAVPGALEVLGRLGHDPPLAEPFGDLSHLALAGAALGALLGLLRRAPRLESLSPFGVALGIAGALQLWVPGVTGARLLAGRVGPVVAGGVAAVTLGAIAGQLLGLVLRRLGARPLAWPVAAAILAAVAVPLVRPRPWGPPEDPRPNVLLLTVDTLREDRLGFAGCPRPVSPHLDRLARRGTTAVHTVTPLPRTLPAFASLMTGDHPPTHGVRDNFHYRLGDGASTLAERLREAGWATAAVNSNPVLSHDSGIYQGFESASDRGDDWSRLAVVRGVSRLRALLAMRAGDRSLVITGLALDWFDRRPRDRPWFLWVHWLAPHMPYEPAYPFDRLWNRDYTGEYARALDYGRIGKGEMTYRNPLDAAAIANAKTLYDGEVATSDRAVGRLLDALEEVGALRGTLVVFTSDHGESLDEHAYFFNHGDFVYGPAANVPLVRTGFAEEPPGGLDPRPICLVDILPALVDGATGDATAGAVDGVWPPPIARAIPIESGFCRFPHLNDRLGWLLPRDVAQNPDLVGDWVGTWEAQANRAKQRAIEIDGWKLVRSPRPDGDRNELFELAADPHEARDVAARHPDRVAALGAVLDTWIRESEAERGDADARRLDEEMRARFEALGYLGD